MLLSEIGDKEIVDISKGSMHGRLWDAEILFDEKQEKFIRCPSRIFKVRTQDSKKICSFRGHRL